MEEQKFLKKKQKAAGNNTLLVSACTDLATYYIINEKFSKAIKEYETLCNIYKEENQMILYAQANRGIGEAYMGLHEFDKTKKHFMIYYNVAVKERNILEQQRALAQLGHLYLTWYLETLAEPNKNLLNQAYEFLYKSMHKCDSLPDSSEKQDMLARLISNLGIVKENLGDYDTAYNLYEKSIKICRNHDFYEQLYRGYLSMASIFEKQEKYQETIKYFNWAVEVAKKLSSKKVELICAALMSKSDTLIKIADFQGAKQVLRKAYKFKTPIKMDHRLIERNLRIVAGMCKMEDDIITCSDQKELKILYEKMGDGACALKNYKKATEYYKKMLEAAEKNGASDKELGECYFSLGETYKDIGDFKEAEIYFEKEFNLCKNNLKSSLDTICKIADLKETAKDNIEQIKSIYERGLIICRKKQNFKEEKRIVLRYVDFLKRMKCYKDVYNLERCLNELDGKVCDDGDISSSSDNESEDSTKIPVGNDLVLSDITDVSEESDNEIPAPTEIQASKRRKQNAVKFKKNLNGEWPLHVACIKGSQKMVQYWLDVDHPVNVRDNAGWLPLHEAAVHGHLEIVKLLLDHKASINDRGGSECNGVTPLHDAASNGHLEVIELLLDRGASAVAKTDNGHTPVFELQKWYKERNDKSLESERLHLYNRIVKRLEEALEKAGQKDEKSDAINLSDKENICYMSQKVGRLRRSIPFDEECSENEFEQEMESYEKSEKPGSKEYQMVMQTLRNKNSCQIEKRSPVKTVNTKRSAHIYEDDFVDADDWLEDDIMPNKPKKRKINSGDLILERNALVKSPVKTATSMIINVDQHESVYPIQDLNEFNINNFESTSSHRRDSVSSNESNLSSFSLRRSQATLFDSGFSRERSKNYKNRNKSGIKRRSNENAGSQQPKITNYATPNHAIVVEADSTTISRSPFTQMEVTQKIIDPMLYVDVEIERKTFRIPVLMSEIQTKTIKWLAEQAAYRYESKEYMRPVLELETVTGVILGDSDLVSLLFPMGSVQAERIVGKVTEWNLPTLLERYQDICTNMGAEPNKDICDLIQNISINLDTSNRGMIANDLNPLLKAINNQKSLTKINLSGNFMNAHSITLLCSSIITLPDLQSLNLSCTSLQKPYLNQLANTMSTHGLLFKKLVNLDFSDNIMLKDDCFNDIADISNALLELQELNLSNIGLKNLSSSNNVLSLKCVEKLNLSYNELNDNDLIKIVSSLDARVLKTLNISRNKGQNILKRILDLFDNEPEVSILDIGLENCGVNDSDLYKLLRKARNITRINISHNSDLTSISLRRLLEHGNLCYINIMACDNIWNYFDSNERGWNIEMRGIDGKAKLTVSGKNIFFFDNLEEMFKDRYKNLEIVRLDNYLSMQVNFS